jgi:hypothetical protein
MGEIGDLLGGIGTYVAGIGTFVTALIAAIQASRAKATADEIKTHVVEVRNTLQTLQIAVQRIDAKQSVTVQQVVYPPSGGVQSGSVILSETPQPATYRAVEAAPLSQIEETQGSPATAPVEKPEASEQEPPERG